MNPILLILAAVLLLSFKKSSTMADDLDAGYRLQDLLYWGIDKADQFSPDEINIVWQFKKLEMAGNFDAADKFLNDVKAIAKKYDAII